ncbi:MAG: hypothetical protein JRJ80_12810 [Deltaproteobacteria bacterium]|nr:hypothetical protein [Deltaproteobacteria bacterium]MBW1905776.1 hypothetical protein [Deltaproteobacteria bacterium]MBW2161168.1 hypothetical protein [Deltaproteobacteria bacterium]MBW2687173.1 hypothetical protein [Deltaproteobacteria bacterium]
MIRRVWVLTGLLILFLQGSSSGHMLLVEHARCTEHGELVHNGAAHQHVAGKHAHSDAPSVHGTPDAGSEQAHDHCTPSVDRRDAIGSIADPLTSTRVCEARRGFALADAFVATDTSRFRIAPKNSPPA